MCRGSKTDGVPVSLPYYRQRAVLRLSCLSDLMPSYEIIYFHINVSAFCAIFDSFLIHAPFFCLFV